MENICAQPTPRSPGAETNDLLNQLIKLMIGEYLFRITSLILRIKFFSLPIKLLDGKLLDPLYTRVKTTMIYGT